MPESYAVQESSGRSRAAAGPAYDRRITVFSPEGRLHQVEYAFNAVKRAGVTSVAVRGDDSVYVITLRKATDKLQDNTSNSHMFAITERLGLVATGMPADGRALAHEARNEAAEFRLKWGYEMPPHVLAQWIATRAQICTQHAHTRPYGIVAMILGIDEEKGTPQLFTSDPAGLVFGHKAVSAGLKESEAMDFLEKKMMTNPSLSFESTIEMALSAMLDAYKEDFGVFELEVGYVRNMDPIFKMRTEAILACRQS